MLNLNKTKMKRILFVLTLVVGVTLCAGYNVYEAYVRSNLLCDVVMANVEALANDESIYDYKQPKTVVCDLREGPWHTGAVERICVFCAVPYVCNPFPCGGN